jgi:hypothetical protein
MGGASERFAPTLPLRRLTLHIFSTWAFFVLITANTEVTPREVAIVFRQQVASELQDSRCIPRAIETDTGLSVSAAPLLLITKIRLHSSNELKYEFKSS